MMTRSSIVPVILLTLGSMPAGARAGDRLVVHPADVALQTAGDSQRLVVLAVDDGGLSRDVTGEVTWSITNGALLRLDDAVLRPVADGETVVTATHEDVSIAVPVTVTGAADPRPISFRLDIIPVLTGAGCNSGACHGSARGQDGFHLSLFGYDPDGDWHRLRHELAGRRVDLAFPDSSLMLRKATNTSPHTGGERFSRDSALYATVRRWIADGAPSDGSDIPRVTGIELMPPDAVIAGPDRTMQLVVRAAYSDGTTRDVTELAVFRSNNGLTAGVDRHGMLRTGEPGEAFVTARYDTSTVGAPFIILPESVTGDFEDPADGGPIPAGRIDELVNVKLAKLRVSPAPLCTDEVFIRRVSLDLVGMLPTPEERAAFLADESPGKRATLVDRLLDRREFADLWVMQWAELLQIRSNQQISEKAALLFFEWVRNAIAADVPIDEVVRRVLTASGGTFSEPATNFYLNQSDALVLAENVAQAFMGIRVQCAQCHNHPFDRWTQDDYYGFAAFFGQVGRKRGEDQRETIVFNRGRGEVNHPVGGAVVPPRFLGGGQPDVRGKDRREVIADWIVSTDNPWFARSFANRVWAHFLGRGIVEPVDDFRVSNPASNDPLLDLLAGVLVESGFDFKQLVREICTSRTYQRSTRTDASRRDERNFAVVQPRRLRAETILDIICQVTDSPQKFKGLPLGARAVEIADGTTSNYFLTTFGRARRDTVCAAEVVREPSLSQALHLINGATISRKIAEGNVVGRRMDAGATGSEIVDELYLRCLGRAPTTDERAAIVAEIEASDDPKAVLEDVFWAVLNAREFVFN